MTGPWEGSLAAYLAAKAAEDDYARDVHDTAEKMTDEIGNTMSGFTDARCAAEDALCSTPARNVADVAYKCRIARERWDGFDIPEDWWTAILSDLDRFGGAA